MVGFKGLNLDARGINWKSVTELDGLEKLKSLVEYTIYKNFNQTGCHRNTFEVKAVNHYCNLTLHEIRDFYQDITVVHVSTVKGKNHIQVNYSAKVTLVKGDVNLDITYEMEGVEK